MPRALIQIMGCQISRLCRPPERIKWRKIIKKHRSVDSWLDPILLHLAWSLLTGINFRVIVFVTSRRFGVFTHYEGGGAKPLRIGALIIITQAASHALVDFFMFAWLVLICVRSHACYAGGNFSYPHTNSTIPIDK